MSKLQRQYINREENAAKKLPFLHEMISKVELDGIHRALEVGCGPGYMSAALRDHYGVDVVGTDVDPVEIRFALEHSGRQSGLTFIEADTTALPFDDAEFDLVLSMMVLHHISNWRDALSEVVRVLKPGGYYLFHDLTYSWFLRAFKPVMRSHAFYSIEEVSSYLNGRGLHTISQSPPHKYMYDQFTEYNIVFQKSRTRSSD